MPKGPHYAVPSTVGKGPLPLPIVAIGYSLLKDLGSFSFCLCEYGDPTPPAAHPGSRPSSGTLPPNPRLLDPVCCLKASLVPKVQGCP